MAGEQAFLQTLLDGLESTPLAFLVDVIRVAWQEAGLPRESEEDTQVASQQVDIALDILDRRVRVESEALASLRRTWSEGFLFEGEEDGDRSRPQAVGRVPREGWTTELSERIEAARREFLDG